MHLIIDADPIVYRCGFASETPTYHLVMEGDEGVYEAVFAPYDGQTAGARMQKWIQDHPDDDVLEKEKVVHPEPESYAHQTVRTQIYSIEKECRSYYQVEDFESISVILSGPGNYRAGLATVFPYKGNRDPDHKPHWYQSIRNLLTREWGASVVHGREADDECSILAHGHRRVGSDYVIATIDKDLDQIPGHHYNYLKQVFYANSVSDAATFFWQQCLSGDATDGVPGCFRVGELRAAAIVSGLCADAELEYGAVYSGPECRAGRDGQAGGPAGNESGVRPGSIHPHSGGIPAHVWAGIVRQYEISQGRNGCPYVESSAEAVALETARLVYLQQQEGELWIPTGPPHDLLEAYKDE
jgi:hypothetical protein